MTAVVLGWMLDWVALEACSVAGGSAVPGVNRRSVRGLARAALLSSSELSGGSAAAVCAHRARSLTQLCSPSRSSILSEVSTRSRSKLPSGKNILVFGK